MTSQLQVTTIITANRSRHDPSLCFQGWIRVPTRQGDIVWAQLALPLQTVTQIKWKQVQGLDTRMTLEPPPPLSA